MTITAQTAAQKLLDAIVYYDLEERRGTDHATAIIDELVQISGQALAACAALPKGGDA